MEEISQDSNLENLTGPKPVVLLLIDGWGVAHDGETNAFTTADTPNFFKLIEEYPVAILSPGGGDINERYLNMGNHLTKVLSDNGLRQIKIAETERFAAATYFFNGEREDRMIGEEQVMISSALSNPMKEVMKETSRAIGSGDYDFIMVVMADIDIQLSRGEQNVKNLIEELDDNLKKLSLNVLDKKGVLIISSATGNAEKIKNLGTETMNKDMTNNPVPLIIIGEIFKDSNLGLTDPLDNDLSTLAPVGDLSNLAPTILKIMNIEKPGDMKGESLID